LIRRGSRARVLAICALALASQLPGLESARASQAVQAGIEADTRSMEGSRPLDETLPYRETEEVRCLALNIYFEARSEPESGQRAVGHVVMNRVAHHGYPDSVCEVVQQGGEERLHRCQFSWWCDGQSDRPIDRAAWDQAQRLARQIYLGGLDDTTGGALWYHATYVTPYWSELLQKGDRIGQHIFYLENQRPGERL